MKSKRTNERKSKVGVFESKKESVIKSIKEENNLEITFKAIDAKKTLFDEVQEPKSPKINPINSKSDE